MLSLFYKMNVWIESWLISLNKLITIQTIINLCFPFWSWLKFLSRWSLKFIISNLFEAVLKRGFLIPTCLNMGKVNVKRIYCLSPSVKWRMILDFLGKIWIRVWILIGILFINSFMFRLVSHFNQMSYSRILISLTLIISLNCVIQKWLCFQIFQGLEFVNCSFLLNSIWKRIKYIMWNIK